MFTVYVTGIATGEELDALVRYDTRDTIRSIVNRLETIVASGIYCATPWRSCRKCRSRALSRP
ncbi:hypothetical protein SAMN05444679_1299 [Variovorax sp. CF079]|uniref:hypothetical protein n=1 Tax=Variovorax sp. CF079 TaxID=1882774 RepID=UPI0008887604|nr:hypothetical protein [Variovorax sp. CF079]SDE71616.1 hypothetical protein SAMN05444679_1299 [Variovorax sp. CF079]